jgi:hypothetical protein
MPDQLARLQEVLGGLRRREADRRGHHRDTVVGAWALAAALVAGLGCGTGPAGQTLQIIDRDRHAQFNAGGQSVVYYRHDERPGATTGIYRVELASGDVHLLVPAILAGLDVHPQTDSIVFSAYGTGQAEPALWLVGLDGGGLRRVGGGGTGPGYRWHAFSADGAPDRGCLGVCFVVAGGSPAPLSAAFMSFTGGWSRDGAQFVYARRMRTYEIPGNPTLSVEESRLWIRTLATGTDRQVTF